MNIAKMIDHSLLRPELTTDDIGHGCEIAARRQVASVCVRPSDVALADAALAGTGVLVGTVAGFPHGDTRTTIKAAETHELRFWEDARAASILDRSATTWPANACSSLELAAPSAPRYPGRYATSTPRS